MDTDTVFAFSAHPTRAQLIVSIRRFIRGQARLFRLAGVLLIVFGLVFSLDEEHLLRIFTVLFGLACILVVPELTVRTVVRKIQGMLSRPTEYRIDEQGVRMTNDLTEFFVRWVAVDRLDEAPGLLIARTGQTGFYAIPTGGLPPETAAEVTEFVRAHVRS
ncbi:YcxB family protein [Actinoplanes subglobosus]|uniref:YcxB family protein n=1 Tax=Actinoplanes subglobosus TaxID=1547892 RepID=A0ABV8IUJ8_9ACTN